MMTPQGRLPEVAGRQGEAFRSPSSPEEDPPKTNSVEKGYDPNYKTYVSVIVLGDEAGYIYQKYSCSLTARWRADPLAGTVREGCPPGQGPLAKVSSLVWKPLFPVFRGGPLPSLGRGNFRFFSPVILLRGDTNSPGSDE